jgi:hypothetical protein
MRGDEGIYGSLFSYIDLDKRARADHLLGGFGRSPMARPATTSMNPWAFCTARRLLLKTQPIALLQWRGIAFRRNRVYALIIQPLRANGTRPSTLPTG